jgi:hypothetical protein
VESFQNEPGFVLTQSVDGQLLYKDNGSDLLAVAHLDTVQDYDHFTVMKLGDEKVLFNCQLDDRLGAYLLLDYLPNLIGNSYDILLTEGEELCKSTAYWFETTKQYKWMFQFDRAGTDVVSYQYESKPVNDLLIAAGWRVGNGSYSDICELDHLNCVGLNFGCGYLDNHGLYSRVPLDDMKSDVSRFLKFYHKHKDSVLPLPEKVKPTKGKKSPQDVCDTGRGSYKWQKYGTPVYSESIRYRDEWEDFGKSECDGCWSLYNIEELMKVGEFIYCDSCLSDMQAKWSRRGVDKYDRELSEAVAVAIQQPAALQDLCPDCGHRKHEEFCKSCNCDQSA